MKTTLYMVISVNGYIAKEDRAEEWISSDNWIETVRIAHEFGNIIFGRKAWDNLKTWDKRYQDDIADVEKIILSSSIKQYKHNKLTYVSSPLLALEYLKNKGLNKALVLGGAELNSSFMKEHLIDEMILNIEPYILGKGIPLFKQGDFESKLQLISSRNLTSQILQLYYKIIKG